MVIQFTLEEPHSESNSAHTYEHCHDRRRAPIRVPIFDDQQEDIGLAGGLLAAHAMLPGATFLVLGCDYPLLPPTALQQLILEYITPVT
jgi:molybdopterin-guanine dinucleotide biosynthesis protein A